ncbi:DUF2089 family protein [Lacticaseibacillus rhamnosus]|uniref:DUF2089 family protein n=1 Tax=Lacticaseibacillus rhamnosus TaxID=47715 RepID=UPI0008A271F7|nr:DUF2089 family protein [Lacticaseibacillus rhamnosus]OFN11734.1 hypothetical protein HMPREF2621_01465 [Lactobacillus sp. HMSC072E07]MDF3333119.1 DUF2089 family protein [Lacticaseibacillus rhamnosus]MDK7183045.1 DUF2089 family protein [Lacticaseibacillus rhamnosus]MDK7241146.1 DUF2089 family protein [Lacticaseibacillus rhamnosus]MDT8864752.1 DUF2089 domain-containing protein [Lacticaseibacillus rhamnosus]
MNPIMLLDQDDQEFVRQFVLSSGSLKSLSKKYSVSYPTIRLRLDRVIQKLNAAESEQRNEFRTSIMQMVIDEKLDLEVAQEIIQKYKETNNG